jgi:hypothetical protein
METALFLTFLVRYIAFFGAVLFVGALVVGSLFIALKNRVLEEEAPAALLQTSIESGAY